MVNKYFDSKLIDHETFKNKVSFQLVTHFQEINCTDDLNEFLTTGKSNDRHLFWEIMKIAPNTSFSLHAHPNIEMIYVIEGAIYEYRKNVI